jgi:hypothetical protein
MKRQLLIASLFIAAITVTMCTSRSNQETENQNDSILADKNLSDSIKIENGSIPIFYNMYLSVEMSTLFKTIGATYNIKLINSPEKVNSYETSTDKALNLGVYAVDLTYAKYFDQFEQAGKYLKNMNKLSTELGIPNDKFLKSVKRIETNLTNKDSLVFIANELYKSTEEYLKANDRESAASLIIAGGWTEALYIATQLVDIHKSDIELIERIAEQRQSAENLLSLLNKYKKESVIKDLIVKLTDIHSSLKLLTINPEDMALTYKQLDDIKLKMSSLRKEMIN